MTRIEDVTELVRMHHGSGTEAFPFRLACDCPDVYIVVSFELSLFFSSVLDLLVLQTTN